MLPAGVRTVEVEVRLARWEADRATGAEHLELARDNLEARAAHIGKEELRRSFLARPLHRRVLEAP